MSKTTMRAFKRKLDKMLDQAYRDKERAALYADSHGVVAELARIKTIKEVAELVSLLHIERRRCALGKRLPFALRFWPVMLYSIITRKE